MKYKPEQEAELKSAYELADSDEARKAVVVEYSEKFQVSKHSIIGKLTSMKVYKKPAPLNKAGEPIVVKQEYVRAISLMLGLPDLESLEKASKRDLKTIMERLVQMSEQMNLRV